MNVTVTKQPKSMIQLTVTIEPDELQSYVERAIGELGKSMRIAGFRPGKAPRELIIREAGQMKLYQQAAESAVEKTYPEAVVQHNLQTIGLPQVSVEKLAPGNPLVYTATVALLPQVKLGNYKKIVEEKKSVAVTSDEVDATIGNLRRMFGKEVKVDRPARQQDKVEIDMETFMDNVPLDGGASKKQPIVIGEGHFIPGFEDALIGLAAGVKKDLTLHFPKEYHRKDLAGKPATFRVAVSAVYEITLPPLDDTFAKQVGAFETLDALRQQIEKNIHEEKTSKERQRWELAVIDRIVGTSTFDEIPDILVDNELHKMLHELEHEVTNQGMKFDDYLASIKKTRDELSVEFRPRAVKRVQTALALRAIARAENITVADSELNQQIDEERKQYAQNPEIIKQINSSEYRDYLHNVMRSRKVFDFFEELSRK